METINLEGVFKQVFGWGQIQSDTVTKNATDVPYVVIPKESQLISLEPQLNLEAPRRKVVEATLYNVDGFVKYVQAQKSSGTMIFANVEDYSLLAVLDYYKEDGKTPGWSRHRAKLKLTDTQAWTEWKSKNNTQVSQTDFAEFVDMRYKDIVSPDAATLKDMVRDLRGTSNAAFSSSYVTETGATSFSFVENIKGTNKAEEIEVPSEITIKVAPWFETESITFKAFFRWRVSNTDRVQFLYVFQDFEDALDAQFKKIVGEIAGQVNLPISFGTAQWSFPDK